MAKFILCNRVVYEGIELRPGKEIDDVVFSTARLLASGAVLAPTPNPALEARAAQVRREQGRGQGSKADSDDLSAAFTESLSSASAKILDVKISCRLATTANIVLSGLQVIDGSMTAADDRVLVKNQAASAENGLYLAKAGAWSRTDDANDDTSVTTGLFTFVEEGTVNADLGFVLATNMPIVLGTTPLTFALFTSSGGGVPLTRTLTAGAGLTGGGDLSADRTFDVVANADGSIVVNADDVRVGILATDAQHGVRGGGLTHALAVPAGAAGFLSGADKAFLDGSAYGLVTTLWVDTSTTVPAIDQDGSVGRPYALVQAAIDHAVAAVSTDWRIIIAFGNYSAETLTIPVNMTFVFEGPVRRNATLGPVNWTATGNLTSRLVFRKLIVGLVTVIDGPAAVNASLNYDRCEIGGITTSGTSFVSCTISGTSLASFGSLAAANASSAVTADIDIDQGNLLIANTHCQATCTLVRGGSVLAHGCTFDQNIQCTSIIFEGQDCNWVSPGPRSITFTGAAGIATLDGLSNRAFLSAAGTVANGVKNGSFVSSAGGVLEPVSSVLLPRFNSSSLYLSFVIGSQTDSQFDGSGNGGLYAIARTGVLGSPPTLAPFAALSGYDDGLTRALFYGGGGWGAPDALEHLFFTAPAYTEVVDTGLQRMIISAAGQVSIGSAAADATGHLRVATALGGVGFRVSVSAENRINGSLVVGADAAITAGFALDFRGSGGFRIARAAATSGTSRGIVHVAAAHTGQTAGAEILDVDFDGSATLQHATGAVATQRQLLVRPRTYSFVAASTITDAAAVAIGGAPIAGANATITNPYALWVQGGKARFQGSLVQDSTITPAALGAGPTADYAPAGLSGARVIRQDMSAPGVVTGLLAQQAGFVVTIMNISAVGANTLTLNHQDAGSAAANRFNLAGLVALVIPAGGSATLWYDGTSGFWRLMD